MIDRGCATPSRSDFDAVVVGASLAGASAAILLARQGARVALVERRPDPNAFKRICGHFIQSSAVPTLERLGLLSEMLAAGAVRSRFRVRNQWGWIEPPGEELVPAGVNLRRERLDPLLRAMAANTAGVELLTGYTAHELLHERGVVRGIRAQDRARRELTLRARLTVGADGRASQIADLAGVPTRRRPHGRFAYSAYFNGPPPAGSPDATVWFGDRDWGAAFPTDSELTLYVCMDLHARRATFREDPAGALVRFLASRPDPPPILQSRKVSPMIGKLDMTNVRRVPIAPGLALVGDAALAADPLWGVGCGWAFQSAEWLATSVARAVRDEEPLAKGLGRYRRRHRNALLAHALMSETYATGRPLYPGERLFFAGAVQDRLLAWRLNDFVTRNRGPVGVVTGSAIPRALAASVRAHSRRRTHADIRTATR
jgi:menaquinone-9 beta-reductase